MRVADLTDTLTFVRVVEERLYGRGARPARLDARAIGRSLPENYRNLRQFTPATVRRWLNRRAPGAIPRTQLCDGRPVPHDWQRATTRSWFAAPTATGRCTPSKPIGTLPGSCATSSKRPPLSRPEEAQTMSRKTLPLALLMVAILAP